LELNELNLQITLDGLSSYEMKIATDWGFKINLSWKEGFSKEGS